MSEKIVDGDGHPIVVSDWVSIYGSVDDVGQITRITDLDGDVDDYGRSYAIPPKVYVKFVAGTEDFFHTSWKGGWYSEDAPFECEDLELCGDRDPNHDPKVV
jgi:hypothetical protein